MSGLRGEERPEAALARGGGPAATSGRLLVVSYHFPTNGAVGGLRWAGLTKYLGRLGWRSWIVTAAPAPSRAEAGVAVISVARRKTLNDRWVEYRASGGRPPPPPAGLPGPTPRAVPAGRVKRTMLRLRQELGCLLAIPDEGRGWVFAAAARVRRLMAEVQPDAVVSSGPPHTAHVAAWLATRLTGVPWFIDLRDPWAAPISAAWRDHPHFRSPVARLLNHTLERVAIGAAGRVICNTRQLTDALRERFPRARTWWIANAVDRETLPAPDADPFPGLALAHVGTVYAGRDLTPVLRGLSRFLAQHPEAAVPGTKLRVAGGVEEKGLSALRVASAEFALENRVELLGLLPRDEALRLAARSRMTIVLAQDQELQVPAKLYEMVALGPPTLVVAGADSAAASEATRLGAVVCDPRDIEGIAATLARVYRGELRGSAGDAATDYGAVAPQVAALFSGAREPGRRLKAPRLAPVHGSRTP